MNTKSEQVQLRRERIRELYNEGSTQRQIAKTLDVSVGQINKDLNRMITESSKNNQHFVDVELPFHFDNAILMMNKIIKETWAREPNDDADFDRLKRLIKDCTITRLELQINRALIPRLQKSVERHQEMYNKTIVVPPGSIEPIKEVAIDNNDINTQPE